MLWVYALIIQLYMVCVLGKSSVLYELVLSYDLYIDMSCLKRLGFDFRLVHTARLHEIEYYISVQKVGLSTLTHLLIILLH